MRGATASMEGGQLGRLSVFSPHQVGGWPSMEPGHGRGLDQVLRNLLSYFIGAQHTLAKCVYHTTTACVEGDAR